MRRPVRWLALALCPAAGWLLGVVAARPVGAVLERWQRRRMPPGLEASAECQGADFSKVAAHLAAGLQEHADRDGLKGVMRAVFLSRGGHAPGDRCPSEPPSEPMHDQICGLLYDGDECTCWAWKRGTR